MLHSESLVVQLLIGLELERQQLIAEPRCKPLAEQILLVLIIGHVPRGVTGEVVELTPISLVVHASLGQVQELPPLEVHDGLGDVSRTKGGAELRPGEDMTSIKH